MQVHIKTLSGENEFDGNMGDTSWSFNGATEEELASHGINIVIYANQLIRAAFPAMQETARGILRAHRALEVDEQLLPFKDIIRLIDEL